jgi:predicted permease
LPEIRGLVVSVDASPDWRVFTYAFPATIGVATGLVAALASRTARADSLIAAASIGGNEAMTGRRRRSQAESIACQTACAVILLVAGGLFVRSTLAGLALDPGFQTAHAVVAQFDPGLQGGQEARQRDLFNRRILDAVAGVPGVERVALASGFPTPRDGGRTRLRTEGDGSGVPCRLLTVSPGFFDTIGLPVRRGRDFTAADKANAESVVILKERTAAALWPGEQPMGRRVRLQDDARSATPRQVVGVVASTGEASADPDGGRFVFVPMDEHYQGPVALVATGPGPGVALIRPVKAAVQRAMPGVVLFDVRPLTEHVQLSVVGVRLAAIVLSSLGLLGTLIAVVGLYGVIAYLVSQRTREFGIMRVLGATNLHIYALVGRQGTRMLLWGVVPGLLVGLALSVVLRHYLLWVKPYDWVTFTVVPVLVMGVGVAACLLPVRRALAADPHAVLKEL